MNPFARKLRREQTNAEVKLWYFLRDRRLSGYKFRRQYTIGSYIVDFCCIEKDLVVELDGGQHAIQRSKDEVRTKYLNDQGYRVFRFWDDEILKNPEVVLEQIRANLENPHPSPLP